MADARLKLGWRRLSGSHGRASVEIIALATILLAASFFSLTTHELAQAQAENYDPILVYSLYDNENLHRICDLDVVGNYAYCSIGTLPDDPVGYFTIIDISDPESPVEVGVVNGTTLNDGHVVHVVGDYAYLTTGHVDNFVILNISDPTDPTIVSWIHDETQLGDLAGVFVVDNYAYIVAHDDYFTVINVENKEDPTIVASMNSATYLDYAYNVWVQGDYAYVTSQNSGYFVVIDIADPTDPEIIGTLAIAKARGLTVSGNYAYVTSAKPAAGSQRLTVVDISVPTSPEAKDYIAFQYTTAVQVIGDYAYVMSINTEPDTGNENLHVVDVSDPDDISLVGSVYDSRLGFIDSILIKGEYVYLGSLFDDRFNVLKVQGMSFTAPVLVSPDNEAITSDTTPSFIWRRGCLAENHRLLIDDDSGFTSPIENVIANRGSFTPADALPGDNYWWKVVAENATDENESAVWEFEVRIENENFDSSDWTYYRQITISPLNTENYQLEVFLDNLTHMNDNLSDLRFSENVASANTPYLKHWVENYTVDNATVWVKRIENLDDNIYLYYGNATAESVENGFKVFILFDDFEDGDTTDWSKESGAVLNATTTPDAGSVHHGSYCAIENGTTEYAQSYKTITPITDNVIVEWYWMVTTTSEYYSFVWVEDTATVGADSAYMGMRRSDTNIIYFDSAAYQVVTGFTDNVWYDMKLVMEPAADQFDIYVDNVLEVSDAATYGEISQVGAFAITSTGFATEKPSPHYIDDMRIRKWADPEPIATLGNEETIAVGDEYERPVEQTFSLGGVAPRGAEFGFEIEQGFSFGAVVAIIMEIGRLVSQAFGLTGAVGVTFGWGKSHTQDFSLDATVDISVQEPEAEIDIPQGFALAGAVVAIAERGESPAQGFSISGSVGVNREFGKDIAQGFSFAESIAVEGAIIIGLSDAFSFAATVTAPAEFAEELDGELSFADAIVMEGAYSRSLPGDFSLGATVDIDVEGITREYERGVAQGFSFGATILVHEYGDIYVTSPWCDNRVNPSDVTDPTPGFSAVYTVVDNNAPNPAMFIHIQVGTSAGDNDLWDNIAAVTIENGQRSSNVSYDGIPLLEGTRNWWRCRLMDTNDNWTSWTPTQTFGYEEAPFDLVAAAMFLFPIALMAMAFAFDNPVFAAFAGVVFIFSGFYFIDVIWLAIVFVGVGIYLLITAFMSERG